jgi:hypothetical protein
MNNEKYILLKKLIELRNASMERPIDVGMTIQN